MPTLDKLANQINQAFEDADWYAGEANQSRINAGKLLLEAQDKFHEWRLATINRGVDGVPSWKTWCEGTIKKANGEPRSWSDIKKVMALARAPDPHAALEAERSARNASMAKSRARKAQGSHVGASATKQERSSISAEGTPAAATIPKTLWVVALKLEDGGEGHYEVFADRDAANDWADDFGGLRDPHPFRITEEPSTNFDLKGWIVAEGTDTIVGVPMVLIQRGHPDWDGGPDRVKGAVPGKTVRDYPAEEPAPAPPPDAPAPPPPQNPASNAAPAPQLSAMRQEYTECLDLVSNWIASNPPLADVRAVMALIRSMQGAQPPRPSEQPGATLH